MDGLQKLQIIVGAATVIGVVIALANSPDHGRRRLLGWAKVAMVLALLVFNLWSISDFLSATTAPSRWEIFGLSISIIGVMIMGSLLIWEYVEYKFSKKVSNQPS
ncbi:hypothetical protein FEM54_05975 [Pseudomonas edaphica]|uniref:Uncharacterized protein n=1 Tax=Pseudomonas edaphica TaxID=2006980 RepID=A0ABY2U985_9PSED|nr:hypothetical protein [Pseudomonas edaphica]TLG92967.1 hypothetical protein FEM54_05975 [Pseudomonas edaphica]